MASRCRHLILCAAVVFVALGLTFANAAPPSAWPKYIPDQIIVKVKPGRASELAALHKENGASVKKSLKELGYIVLKLPKGADLEKALARYRKHSAVEYAGVNHLLHIVTAQVTPNDPRFTAGDDYSHIRQWGLYNNGSSVGGVAGKNRADIWAKEAWAITTGSPNVPIAILDTGVDYTHEDLASKIWINPGEWDASGIKQNNNLDDDGNGFIDDWHGWDFIGSDYLNPVESNDPMDDNQVEFTIWGMTEVFDFHHGTLIAGIAGAATNNGEGIAGVAWGCPIVPIKVADRLGVGPEDIVAEGVVYAANLGVKVLNLSLAGDQDVQALHDAIDYAWNHGCICVCATGNEDTDINMYPAYYSNAFAVGGTDNADNRWIYDQINPLTGELEHGGSNYGSYVDIAAPASNIVSTGPFLISAGVAETPYDTESGTSASAPFVSGVCALVWSQYPGWTNQQVVQQIENTADDLGTTGWDQYFGWGRVNAYRALTDLPVTLTSVAALKQQTIGQRVKISGRFLSTASTSITNRMYIQERDRSNGILVYYGGPPPAGFNIGDKVDVEGRLGLYQGECAIMNPTMTLSVPAENVPPKALAVSGKSMGGGPLGRQVGVVDYFPSTQVFATGLNNVGLLVKIDGWVNWTGIQSTGPDAPYGWFYVDDGSELVDWPGYTGVYVNCGSVAPPNVGDFVGVTGISGCESLPAPYNSTIRRVLRMRATDTIKTYKHR